ncbi:unnamed protein product [Brassica rapa subsp. narinosa]
MKAIRKIKDSKQKAQRTKKMIVLSVSGLFQVSVSDEAVRL